LRHTAGLSGIELALLPGLRRWSTAITDDIFVERHLHFSNALDQAVLEQYANVVFPELMKIRLLPRGIWISRRRLTLSIGCFLALVPLLKADALDDSINALLTKRQVPGLSLAIIQDGKIVRAQGYGVIEAGHPAPVTTDTLFQAGSVSKPVGALGALALVEAGKLSLDADINTVLKSWQVPENQYTKTEKVTLRRLLSHSSGLTVHGFRGYAVNSPLPTLVQVLNGEQPANSAPIRVDFEPGSKWRYAGGGYTVMQQAMIDVTGQTFAEFMHQTVLLPLGMKASSYDQPLSDARAALTATGHYRPNEIVLGRWHVYPEMAAAGLWTTPSDLARFAIAIQDTLAGRAHPVISQTLIREMLKPQKEQDGLGVFLAGHGKAERFEHNGRNEGFDTLMTAYLETGQGAVVMININDNSNTIQRITELIADAYHWPEYPHSKPAKAIADKEPGVTLLVRKIFEEARAGRFDRELFTPELSKAIEQALAGGATQQLQSSGAIKAIELTERKDNRGNRIYRYRLIQENATTTVNCVFNPEGKIAGLWFKPE
jgi:CubicO group peptidase (beta-lactamase class C family)